jgi:hypothetical protein
MDEQAASEFLFEPGGFRRHDLPLFPQRPGGLLKREKGDSGERPHQLFFICKFLPRRHMESNGKCLMIISAGNVHQAIRQNDNRQAGRGFQEIR